MNHLAAATNNHQTEVIMNQTTPFGNPEQTMSTREIAVLVEKQHSNIKISAERLTEKGVIGTLAMQEFIHNGNKYTEYLLGKRDSLILVAQNCPEFTARIVDRWQELENQQAKPALPNFANPAEAARAWAVQFEQKQAALEQLEAAKPAVEFVGRYVEATGTMTFTEVCKVLGLKRHELRQIEQNNRVMYQLNGRWVPYQHQIDSGRFTVKTGSADNGHAFAQARYTSKGVEYLAKLAGLEVAA